MTLFYSPAKINLFFNVLGTRKDHYHEIASLYQAISLFDRLYISPAIQDRFTCSDQSLIMDENNLVVRALRLFREKSGINAPVEIHLEKQIPMQAGLGGGSSNAATTLFALSSIFMGKIDEHLLMQWGSFLGSDVPFFFSKGVAYCTGRGEKVEFLKKLDVHEKIWIAKPFLSGLSTAEVYRLCDKKDFNDKKPLQTLERWIFGGLDFYNDLEASAFRIMPSLLDYKKYLLDLGFKHVVMTGSGSAFICIGSIEKPPLDCVSVSFCYRKSESWYELL